MLDSKALINIVQAGLDMSEIVAIIADALLNPINKKGDRIELTVLLGHLAC